MSLLTSVEKLNFNNFVEWKFVVEALIVGEGGDLTKLNDCAKALQILRASVSEEIIPFIQSIPTAQETMIALEAKFGKPNGDVIFEKLISLVSIKKKIDENINQFISRCRQLYNEINPNAGTMRRTKKKREKKIKKNFRKRKMPMLLNYCPYHMM